MLQLWCQIWFPISYVLALNMTQVRWLTKHHEHVISNTLEREIQVNFISRYHLSIGWSFFLRVALTTNIVFLPPPPFSYFPPLCLLLTLSSHSPHKRACSLDVRGEETRDVWRLRGRLSLSILFRPWLLSFCVLLFISMHWTVGEGLGYS